MSDIELGQKPTQSSERDAIHVAITPMVAAEMLRPGQRVGVMEDGTAGPSDKVLGIVDPYLLDVVPKGELFWMCLLPNTVTGMRHHWSHPSFEFAIDDSQCNVDSEAWLREYAKNVNNYDPEGLAYERLVRSLKDGEFFTYGTDCHSFADVEKPDELAMHAERALGIKIDWSQFTFSCSC